MSHKKKQNDQDKLKDIETCEQEELKETDNKEQEEESEDIKEKNAKNDTEQSDSDKKDDEINCLKDQLQRLAAEFDNYKKRTAKEKEKLYDISIADTVSSFLPVIDNVERALMASENGNEQSIREGVNMIYRQMQDVLSALGVEYIEAIGKKFDPELHEAVMHIEDEERGDNEIVEEFRKGYKYKNGIVIRHSVVKVAN